jgi:hypothetical protein
MKETFTIAFILINLFALAQFTDHSNQIESRINIQEGQLMQNTCSLFSCNQNELEVFPEQSQLSLASQVQILDSALSQQWDQSANAWVTAIKYEYYHDDNLNLIKEIFKTTVDLISNSITEYTYDTKGNKTQSIVSFWSKSKNQWIYYSKVEYMYYSDNIPTQKIDYYWDSTLNDWLTDSKHEYTFDPNGNITLYVKYKWNPISNQWGVNHKEEFTYNTSNKQTFNIASDWDLFSNDWIVSSKIESIYDANGNKTQQINYSWFSYPKLWGINAKSEYTFDSNGDMTQGIDYSYNTYYANTIKSELINKIKYDCTYESDGGRTQIIYYLWDVDSNNWKVKNKEEYIYDSNNNTTQIHDSYWNIEKTEWTSSFRFIYYYSEHSHTSVDGINNQIIALYPNPVSDNLQIRLYSTKAIFELFDINGNNVLSKEIKNSETLDLKNYNKGIYIYHILSNGKEHSGRLLKD